MSEFDKMRYFNGGYINETKKGKSNDENDEGIFVSESNGEEEDDFDDDDEELFRKPRTEFEKSLSRIDNTAQEIKDDIQMLGHDLRTLESKNESTERRILKLMRDAAEFRAKLQGLLVHYSPRQRYGRVEENIVRVKQEDTLSALPSQSFHTASLKVLLKQNSIEQPIHVNIAVDDSGTNYNVY